MIINYSESVSLLSWGFFLDDNEKKIKFNNVLGNSLYEKISAFEEEKYYIIIKRDVVDSFIETINKNEKCKNKVKEIGETLIKNKISNSNNSDIVIPISLNDITELSMVTIERRKANFNKEEIYKRLGNDMAELEKLSKEVVKMSGFSIPNEKMKEVMKIINKNNLISSDIELFQKIEKDLSELTAKNQVRRKI